MQLRLVLGTLVGVVAAVGGSTAQGGSTAFAYRAVVSRVVDGDTVVVRIAGGKTDRVRLLGIDAPETTPRECYAAEAKAEVQRLAQGKRVRLVGDPTQAPRDRFRRLLAYMALPNGQDLGRRLVIGGFARVFVFGRPFRRVRSYRASESAARNAGRGLWSACQQPADLSLEKTPSTVSLQLGGSVIFTLSVRNNGPGAANGVRVVDTVPGVVSVVSPPAGCTGTAPLTCTIGALASGATARIPIAMQTTAPGTITNSATVTATTQDPNPANNSAASIPVTVTVAPVPPLPPPTPPPVPANCHPSYPSVCIPPPPPDLDCGQIPYRDFPVLPPDPHRFDGDGDGRGCED